ncbi:MAG: hypothetical protein NVV73_00870 [Cellvibrionaceae bacterium]|nr:hypothetical protein [Cellvibrionaceae bacterium]
MTEVGRYIPDEIPGDFWRIIDACEGKKELFNSVAEKLSEDDLLRFCWNHIEASGQIATLYHELTSFSEDSIEDICNWIVSRGESVYTDIWDDAENVITKGSSPYGQTQKDPGLLGEAMKLFRHRYGKDVPRKRHDKFV